MRPFDPRLVKQVPATRLPVAVIAALGVVAGILAVAQAFAIAALVVAVVHGHDLRTPAIAVLALLIGRGLVTGAGDLAAAWAGSRISSALRDRFLSGVLHQPADERAESGTLVTLATAGAASVEPYVARYLPALITAAVVPPLVLLALLFTDWPSFLIVVITLPLLPLFAALIGRHTQTQVDKRWAASNRLAGHFLDVMRGLPTLVGYQRAEHQVGVVAQVSDQHRKATNRTLRTAFLSSAALELLATICVAMVAVAVGLRLAGGHMLLGVGLTAILLAPEAYWPIRRVGQEFHTAADGVQAIDALLADAPATPSSAGAGALTATDLTYRYPGTEYDVIAGLSLTLEPGLTAIVGESGAGKTTLLELLAGLRTPTHGTVQAPRTHLVTQRPLLIPGTVADNLRLGNDASDDELRKAMQRTGFDAVVASLPDGLDTSVGDDGSGLSAGQRGLLALTRAVLDPTAVILLDEPTAHLDTSVSAGVDDALRTLSQDRTIAVVTHDPMLTMYADRVVTVPVTPGAESAVVPVASDAAEAHQPLAQPSSPEPEIPARQPVLRPAKGVIPAALVGSLATMCGVALTATSGWLIVQASLRPVVLTLLVAIVAVRTFGIGRPVLRYTERLLSHNAALRDLTLRRTALFARLIPLTPARLGRQRRGDVLNLAVHDLDDEVDAQVRVLVPAIGTILTLLIAVIVATALLPVTGLVLLAIALIVLLIGVLDFVLERQAQPSVLQTRGDIAAVAELATSNATALQGVHAQEPVLSRLQVAQERSARVSLSAATARATGDTLSLITVGIATVAIAVLAGHAVSAERISLPVAGLLTLLPVALTDVLTSVPDIVNALCRSLIARRRLVALTDQEPAVRDRSAASTPPVPQRPTLQLAQVNASWDDVHDALRHADLRVAPGEHIALVGDNGTGKSTALAVLARHLEPTAGRYTVDGVEVGTWAPDDVRRLIALVDDEPHVFAGSVRANLLLARPHATDHEVTSALIDSGLGHWLGGLPHGLDTMLGTGQRGVSGGERTRLAIARAVLSGRPVVLLDEPVAHLDVPTARSVLSDVQVALRESSLVIVSHQQIGLEGCDRVVALRDPAEATRA
ncbi:ATP-binding cassette subfamily C protein CydCD [Branchiibius hedensis]|uniref:ATP-binding cassette, subfamily C, CydCD n=1 Tax=Branchiibius hedensis TaxID=672460 RepID=A0A2Y8ZVI7_9MICO|nr:thiol reductant ABC exporter subunit CydD [Branchiibius hedensis]PWJ27283.1 ATP-binding cassette subfamily C protein CydCD [Branchiibius hedensis]SSA36094.1 ATP-binding cassette, subfamily C, CydCD [Branchiibius hedensis]